MSAIFLFSALGQIKAPVLAWAVAAVCTAIDFYILKLIVNER